MLFQETFAQATRVLAIDPLARGGQLTATIGGAGSQKDGNRPRNAMDRDGVGGDFRRSQLCL